MNRVTLAKSLVATRPLVPGDVIEPADVAVKGPGRGLQPNRRADLVGRVVRRSVAEGGFFYPSDLEDAGAEPRPYGFRRPWGVPVRYHDAASMVSLASPDFVEFHLSYKDLELDPAPFLEGIGRTRYAVHSPDLFAGDHLLNLAAPEGEYRQRTLNEFRRTIDTARRLGEYFDGPAEPVLVVSMGGFSSDRPVPHEDRAELYERIANALDEVVREVRRDVKGHDGQSADEHR